MAHQTKKQLTKILAEHRLRMKVLDNKKTALYENLVARLGLRQDSYAEGSCWDYIFNGYGNARRVASEITRDPKMS